MHDTSVTFVVYLIYLSILFIFPTTSLFFCHNNKPTTTIGMKMTEQQPHVVHTIEVPRMLVAAVNTIKDQVKDMRFLIHNNALHQNSKQTIDSSKFELESRLGTMDNGSFLSGIKKKDFDRIHDMLNTGNWDNNPEWYKYTDYFYKTTMYNKGMDIRTTVGDRFATNEHLVKRTISKRTFNTNTYSMRVSLSQEVVPNTSLIPDVVNHYTYRKKVRKDFLSKHWCYSLSTVIYPKCSAEHYEVEIECVDPSEYINADYHTNEYVSLSLLLKTMQLIDSTSHVTPITDTT
jgi:hypothetical protein